MQNKIVLIPLGVFLFLLISCQKAILMVAGMKPPKIENEKSVKNFLLKMGEDTTNVFAVDTTLYEHLRSLPFKPGWKPGLRPVQIRVYDKAGHPIMHWASCEGYLKDLKTFDTVPPRNQGNLDSTFNLEQDLSRYFTLEGKKPEIKIDYNYDYHIIVYFAKYIPKQSRQSFYAVNEYIKNNPLYKFKVYKIDIDVLDWWDAELITDIKIK